MVSPKLKGEFKMGQTYTVEASLLFKDGKQAEAFCDCFRRKATSMLGVSAILQLENADMSTPFGCFKVITTPNAFQSERGGMYADFDGSYGWEGVLLVMFEETSKYLDDGSLIAIYPDDAQHIIEVLDGKVIHKYRDNGYEKFREVWYERGQNI